MEHLFEDYYIEQLSQLDRFDRTKHIMLHLGRSFQRTPNPERPWQFNIVIT